MKRRDFTYGLIEKNRLAAVIRGGFDEAVETAARLVGAGIKLLEVTFTVPRADEVIKELSLRYGTDDGISVGAGTVLDAETARIAILSGAEFIVSPGLSIDVIKTFNRYSAAVIPGIATATELMSALEYGADFVKLFPANREVLKALKGPFPNVQFMATGGITEDNLKDWFSSGASAVGAGSNLTAKGANIKKWLD